MGDKFIKVHLANVGGQFGPQKKIVHWNKIEVSNMLLLSKTLMLM